MKKIKAMVHSLDAFAKVEILKEVNNNEVYARYQNLICTAIFNPFTGCYYVDDKYGILSEDEAKRLGLPV